MGGGDGVGGIEDEAGETRGLDSASIFLERLVYTRSLDAQPLRVTAGSVKPGRPTDPSLPGTFLVLKMQVPYPRTPSLPDRPRQLVPLCLASRHCVQWAFHY